MATSFINKQFIALKDHGISITSNIYETQIVGYFLLLVS